jgi:hypothetical protein
MEILAPDPAKGKILYGWTVKYFPLEALANLSICHPEHSEGSFLVLQKQILRSAQDDRIRETDFCETLDFVLITKCLYR